MLYTFWNPICFNGGCFQQTFTVSAIHETVFISFTFDNLLFQLFATLTVIRPIPTANLYLVMTVLQSSFYIVVAH